MKSKFEKPFSELTSLIAKNSTISGTVVFSGELAVEGTINGDVIADGDSKAKITVLETGTIKGKVYVPQLTINGTVNGDVFCSQSIKLSQKAKYSGSIVYSKLEIAAGAVFNGEIKCKPAADIAKMQPENKKIPDTIKNREHFKKLN